MNNSDVYHLDERYMELTDLRIFRTVVAEGGVTRAAKKLHRVQSNVTTRVRQLEEDLGVKLFIREGKRLHLSPQGRILTEYADRLLDLAREAREAVQDGAPRGVFRLGSMESTAAVRLPGPLSIYHRRFEEVSLELRTGNPMVLSAALLDGEIDAALVAEPVTEVRLEQVPVFNEELVLVAPADQTAVTPGAGMRGRTLLVLEAGCPHRQRLEDWFAENGEQPERIIEVSSYHALLGCAAAGMGVSLLPRIMLETFPARHRLLVHPLPAGRDHARTLLIWRKGSRSPKIDALLEILDETAARPATDP
jgi:DNA-binding transcriptional LysR family regulator